VTHTTDSSSRRTRPPPATGPPRARAHVTRLASVPMPHQRLTQACKPNALQRRSNPGLTTKSATGKHPANRPGKRDAAENNQQPHNHTNALSHPRGYALEDAAAQQHNVPPTNTTRRTTGSPSNTETRTLRKDKQTHRQTKQASKQASRQAFRKPIKQAIDQSTTQ
jgi:hypothetical protein